MPQKITPNPLLRSTYTICTLCRLIVGAILGEFLRTVVAHLTNRMSWMLWQTLQTFNCVQKQALDDFLALQKCSQIALKIFSSLSHVFILVSKYLNTNKANQSSNEVKFTNQPKLFNVKADFQCNLRALLESQKIIKLLIFLR